MNNQPLVSILCLCYNQAQFIVESLESIKSQTYKNYELIICDDHSKDNSVEVVEDWLQKNLQIKTQFVKHTQNKGICKSLNEIFKLSCGKYIQMLALDDTIMPNKLEKHVDLLEKSKSTDAFVFSDALLIDNNSNILDNRFIGYYYKYLNFESGNYYNKLIEDNFIPAMSVLLKSEIIKEENGWDENLNYEDYDMWLRISKNYDFIFSHEPSCSYRIHLNNTHTKVEYIESSYFEILYKHINHPNVKNKLFKIVERLYLSKKLNKEHLTFYQIYPGNSFSDRLIKNNKWRFIYKLIKSIRQFKKNMQ